MDKQNLPVKKQDDASLAQEKIRGMLANPSVKSRFDDMLGKKAAGFVSSILSAVASNKELGKCDPRSVVSSAAIAASMDLPINASLGFAHIVPYKGVAQFQMGWRGYLQLAMRSGQYKTINATPVYQGQIETINPFTGDIVFAKLSPPSQTIVGYMLYFKLVNGFEKYFYMTKEECEAHGKRYSASFKKGFGQWKDNFDAMALKTVIKLGLSKYGILSLDMQRASSSESIPSPARSLIDDMSQEAEFDQASRQVDEVHADTMPDYETQSQEVAEEAPAGIRDETGADAVERAGEARAQRKGARDHQGR